MESKTVAKIKGNLKINHIVQNDSAPDKNYGDNVIKNKIINMNFD